MSLETLLQIFEANGIDNDPCTKNMLEESLPDTQCNHNVINTLSTSISNKIKCTKYDIRISLDLIYDLYKINNGEICWPPPKLNPRSDDAWEEPSIVAWKDAIGEHFFCQNCWLSLLCSVHAPIPLEFIYSYASTIKFNEKDIIKYLTDKYTLIHFRFLLDLLRYPFVNKLVFKQKNIYRPLLNYFLLIMKFMFCTDIYLIPGGYNVTDDIYFIFTQSCMGFIEEFHKCAIFWRRQNHNYLLTIEFKQLLTEKIPNYLIKNELQSKHQIGQRNVFQETQRILELIIGYDYKAKCKLLNDEQEKDTFFSKLMFLLVPDWGLNKYTNDTLVYNFCDCMEVDKENKSIGYTITTRHREYIPLIYYETKVDKNKKEWMDVMIKYKNYCKLMKICFNPCCNIRKYERDIKSWADWCKSLYGYREEKLKRKTFYVCKGCFIAVYCSRTCQKMHWNRYNHRVQCFSCTN
eukprot:376407_1